MNKIVPKRSLLVVGSDSFKHTVKEAIHYKQIRFEEMELLPGIIPQIEAAQPDILFLDTTSEFELAMQILSKAQDSEILNHTAVIAYVNHESDQIEDVLNKGATDYVTEIDQAQTSFTKVLSILDADTSDAAYSDIELDSDPQQVEATGVRVFVIEDDPLLKNLLSARFKKASFPHEFNSSGIGVLPALTQFKPDVIILDIRLPGVDGLDLLMKIKQSTDHREIPVIVFSNIDSQENRDRATELGADAFFVKALTDLSLLVEKIESLAISRASA